METDIQKPVSPVEMLMLTQLFQALVEKNAFSRNDYISLSQICLEAADRLGGLEN